MKLTYRDSHGTEISVSHDSALETWMEVMDDLLWPILLLQYPYLKKEDIIDHLIEESDGWEQYSKKESGDESTEDNV